MLAGDGLLQALHDHGHQQVLFVVEVVERRTGLHADSTGNFAGAGGIKALGFEQITSGCNQGLTAVAVVFFGLGFFGTPAGAFEGYSVHVLAFFS